MQIADISAYFPARKVPPMGAVELLRVKIQINPVT
jgi:hypothetical protein